MIRKSTGPSLHEVHFALTITSDEFLRYYRGEADQVVVTAHDGRVVRFPANVLRRFLTHSGISGRFVLRYDAQGKFHSVERVGA